MTNLINVIDAPESNNTVKTLMIIGATGGVGGAVAKAALENGWRVRALTRRKDQLMQATESSAKIEWIYGDAMNAADVLRAAQEADCILHAANPPKYKKWRELALPMLSHAIAAATSVGARLILPGNIYNFGPDAWPLVSEESPQYPRTRKGKVRVEMEQMMQQASRKGARMMVVRAGDFFGANAPSSWFAALMVKPGKPLRSILFPGEKNVGHAWAYLPDLANTIMRLASMEKNLAPFEIFHFAGHWTQQAIELPESIRRAAGKPTLPIRNLPWTVIYLAAPLVDFFRELVEMRYLWQVPVQLDNRKLLSVLGEEPHTDLDEAVKSSLREMACI